MADSKSITNIEGVDPERAESLREAGIESVEDVRAADAADLAESDGISEELAAEIKEEAGTDRDVEETVRSSDGTSERGADSGSVLDEIDLQRIQDVTRGVVETDEEDDRTGEDADEAGRPTGETEDQQEADDEGDEREGADEQERDDERAGTDEREADEQEEVTDEDEADEQESRDEEGTDDRERIGERGDADERAEADDRPNEEVGLEEIRELARDAAETHLDDPLDGIIELGQDDSGWFAIVEVVERSAVPDTQDILGRYEIEIDTSRSVTGYRLMDRYRRGNVR